MSDSKKIVEDSPTMRSVALVAPPMMPSMRPLQLHSSTEDSVAKLYTTPTQQKTASTNHHPVVSRFPSLPIGSFLERTHVRIHEASPEEVMSRVSAILMHESVATKYDLNEVQIACETVDHVECMIRFYQTDDDCILVEAQRLCGCSYSFHQLAKSVLRSAKGLPPAAVAAPRPLPKCIPRSTQEEIMSCTHEGIDIAVSLLQQASLDAQLLGLESLVQISQDGLAAEAILGKDEILHCLLSLLALSDKDSEHHLVEHSNESKLHRAALTVVANCLESLQQQANALDRAAVPLLNERIVSGLLHQVRPETPHEACQAIRILQVLAHTEGKPLLRDAPVLVARAPGRHARLGELSQQFLQTWEQ